jgi:hypothetical protein
MKMFMITIIAVGMAFVVLAVLFNLLFGVPTDLKGFKNGYQFSDGRLFAVVKHKDNFSTGIVDTGSSTSVLPKRWFKLGKPIDHVRVQTRVRIRDEPIYRIRGLQIADQHIEQLDVISKLGKNSIIGLDYIIKHRRIVINKNGISEATKDNKSGLLKNCGSIILDFQGNDMDSGIESIYFLMKIDNKYRKVFFDSGNDTFLQATSLLNKKFDNESVVKSDIMFNSLFEFNIEKYKLGSAYVGSGINKKIEYKHFFEHKSVNAEFVLGSKVFQDYEVEIDFDLGRYCIFSNPS